MKVHVSFKNSLPFKEQPQRSLSAYMEQKDKTHSRENNSTARITESPERNTPFFQMLNSQQVAFKLRYSDVVLSVLRLTMLVYNKLIEVNKVANFSMNKTLTSMFHKIDKDIVDKVLHEICGDLNLVARRKAQHRLAQMYSCLDLCRLPNVMTPRSAAQASTNILSSQSS